MKTRTVNIYSFSELSEKAKENALLDLYDLNVDFDWWQDIYYDAEQIGLKITSFDLDRNKHATGKFLLVANEVAQNILNNHGETCQTYKTAESFLDEWLPIFNDYMDENSEHYESYESEKQLSEIEDQFFNELLSDYADLLQREYEYRTSEEAIIETIEANEYEFYKNGDLA